MLGGTNKKDQQTPRQIDFGTLEGFLVGKMTMKIHQLIIVKMQTIIQETRRDLRNHLHSKDFLQQLESYHMFWLLGYKHSQQRFCLRICLWLMHPLWWGRSRGGLVNQVQY